MGREGGKRQKGEVWGSGKYKKKKALVGVLMYYHTYR